jgi:hypothetical protein
MILTVHDGKGQKDRSLPLPSSIVDELKEQINSVWKIHEDDLRSGYSGTFMFGAIEKKYPNAAKEFIWQWLFPAKSLTVVRYSSHLVTTRCNYGGFRWWYLCPNTQCRNRVGKLYMPYHAKYFLCRDCHNLTYESCRESHKFDRLFEQIGAVSGVPPRVAKKLLEESFSN